MDCIFSRYDRGQNIKYSWIYQYTWPTNQARLDIEVNQVTLTIQYTLHLKTQQHIPGKIHFK